MPSKYKISDHQDVHFITFATVQWVDALSRREYKEIMIASFKHCQKYKAMMLYAYVIMSNHVHLIASAKEGINLSDILRDMKKHTSKQLLAAIENNIQESRRNWMMWIFRLAGKRNPNNKDFQLWQQDNRPIQLSTAEMVRRCLEYIHYNPVKEGIVDEPEHYRYSSAADYAGGKGKIDIEFLY